MCVMWLTIFADTSVTGTGILCTGRRYARCITVLHRCGLDVFQYVWWRPCLCLTWNTACLLFTWYMCIFCVNFAVRLSSVVVARSGAVVERCRGKWLAWLTNLMHRIGVIFKKCRWTLKWSDHNFFLKSVSRVIISLKYEVSIVLVTCFVVHVLLCKTASVLQAHLTVDNMLWCLNM